MSVKYHISSTTQRPNICRAKSPETCPLKSDDGTPPPHFETKEEARAYVEKSNEEKYGDVPETSSTSKIKKDSKNSENSRKSKIIERLKHNGYKISEDEKTINYHGLTRKYFDMKISYNNNGDLNAELRDRETSDGFRQMKVSVRKRVKVDDRNKMVKDKDGNPVFENFAVYSVINEPRDNELTREEAIRHLRRSEEFNEQMDEFQRRINTAVVSNHAVFGDNENRPEDLEMRNYNKEPFLEDEHGVFNGEGKIQGEKNSNIFTHYDNVSFDKRFPVTVEKRPIPRSYNHYSYSSKIDVSEDFNENFNDRSYDRFQRSLLRYENAIMESNDLLDKAERADYLQPGNSRYLSTYA